MESKEIYNELFLNRAGHKFIIRAMQDDKEITVAVNLSWGESFVPIKLFRYDNELPLEISIKNAKEFAEHFVVFTPSLY